MSERFQPLPRRLVHRGTVEAAGFFLDASLSGEAEVRRRILALWAPGTRVIRTPDGWLALLPHPRAVHAGTAPGLPLTAHGGALLGAPLSPRELESLGPAAGEVGFLHAGRWVREPLHGAGAEDPAAWLDVEGFAGVGTATLGAPPAVPRAVPEPPIPEVDLRKRLEGIPDADPELEAVVERLRKGKEPGGAAGRKGLSVRDLFTYGADLVRYGFSSLFRRRQEGPAGAPGVPREPSRLWTALRRLASNLLFSSPLARVVGRRHALYIQRMIEMFESGDIESALRHAIPLEPGLQKIPPPVSFGLPSPRADLSIRPGVTPARSSTPFDLFSDLQQLYRRVFERLEAQGRIQEAAFLLAEVMNAHEEAVAFLEKHGQLKLAAEMAEARELPAGLVVRQWFLAGNRERALSVARRRGAFGDAVGRLERSGKGDEARLLRMLWASGLAEAGDYAAAVDAAWPVSEARALSREWIDRAIAQGGEGAGRMLARKVLVAPGPFGPLRDEALELLESRGAERIAGRLAFAETLLSGSRTPEAQVLARAALRAAVRDSALSSIYRMPPAELRKLADFAGDGPLRTDAPALEMPAKRSWTSRGRKLDVQIEPWDVGSLAAHDAAFLPDGRLAVALGEAGVRLLSRAGRTAAELDQPAQRLIVSDHGDRAIAMARRGEVWKLSRLDFAAWRSEPWTDARLQAWAADYDGGLWYVAGPEGFVAVEASSPRFDGPWGLSNLPGPILSIARSATNASLLVAAREELEVWTYELPSLTLRIRETVPQAGQGFAWRAISPRGLLAQLWLETPEEGEEGEARLRLHDSSLSFEAAGIRDVGDLRIAGEWIALPFYEPAGLRLHLVHRPTGAVAGTVTLGRTTQAAVRLTNETLTLADELGRVLVLDLDHGQVLRNLRL